MVLRAPKPNKGIMDDGYDITHGTQIGQGAFGVVYRVKFKKSRLGRGKTVAVKVVSLDHTADETRQKCDDRLKKVVELDHINLVRCLKFSKKVTGTEAKLHVVMDYCNGGNLASLLQFLRQDGCLLCPKTAARYAAHIARGLEYLHEKLIIHGDLKPKNIFVNRQKNGKNRLQIGDLDDLVELQGPITKSNDVTHVRGTVRYMSPEMVIRFWDGRRAAYPGRSTDIWSLGCIILELANHVIDNDVKWLQNDQDMRINATNLPDVEFAMLVAEGYVPALAKSTPPVLAGCVLRCLKTNEYDRISAKALAVGLGLLKKSMPREMIMLFHRRPGKELFGQASAQWLDPRSWKVHNVPLPTEENELFSNAFTALRNELICQTVSANETQREFRTATVQCKWGSANGVWNRIRLDGCESRIMYCPVRTGKVLYYFAPHPNPDGELMLQSVDLDSQATTDLYILPAKKNLCAKDLRAVRSGSKIFYLGTDVRLPTLWMASFDTATRNWRDLPNFPDGRFGFAMVMLHGNLYVLGGATRLSNPLDLLNTTFELPETCYRYMMQTEEWQRVANLLQHRMDHTAFVINRQMYVYGGTGILANRTVSTSVAMRTVEMYDVVEDKWSVASVSFPKTADYSRDYCSTASVQLHLPVAKDRSWMSFDTILEQGPLGVF